MDRRKQENSLGTWGLEAAAENVDYWINAEKTPSGCLMLGLNGK